jgi:hypothetical protein
MGNRSGENLHVTYPCYRAKLTVDPALGALLAHEAPLKAGPNADLTDAQKILAEQT